MVRDVWSGGERTVTPRCGFYVEDGRVKWKTVYITWDAGFDKEAKHYYIQQLHDKLSDFKDVPMLEVTSAAPTALGRSFSPYYARIENMSMEDYWHKCKLPNDIVYKYFDWPISMKFHAFTHFYCYYMRDRAKELSKYGMFTDVFYNPEKEIITQAEACAILKCMYERNELDILDGDLEFVTWYREHGWRLDP